MFRPRLFILVALLAGVIGLGGCARPRSGPPAPEDVVLRSDAILFRGYRSTVAVKASPGQIMDFLSTPEGLVKLGVFKSVKLEPGSADVVQIGHKVRTRIQIRGVEVPILFTNVKAVQEKDYHEYWLASSHPFISIQRWRLKPDKEGCELDFELYSEEPTSWAGKAIEGKGLFEDFCDISDAALANLQANFDPQFNRPAAYAKGRRGEIFEVLLQSHLAESRIAAPPARVFDYLKRHKNFASLLGEAKPQADCLEDLDVAYCPFTATLAAREVAVNQFIAGYKVNEQITAILSWSDFLAVVQFKLEPQSQKRACLVKVLFAVQLPESGSSLDLLYAMTKVPKQLVQVMTRMKQDLEGSKPAPVSSK